MHTVVQVEALSKSYRLGSLDRRSFFRGLRARLSGNGAPAGDAKTFWALRDVSFSVADGEVVGFLGRNGAGKSTLLKILSGITSPTEGRVRLRGRVASLLEVGTGFHMELNGRENIFLNGAILGMSRREVTAKFDEIVAFSGVEPFIDTPVKRYSSGMRVRLAFAVAAHLDAEIVVVDEVLAVGDFAFQKKCLGKMGELATGGRTVLFVSHDTASVEALCRRAIVLDGGRMTFDGTQTDGIAHYSAARSTGSQCLRDRTDRGGSGEVRVTALEIRDRRGAAVSEIQSGAPCDIVLRCTVRDPQRPPPVAAQILITTHTGAPVFSLASWLTGNEFPALGETGALVCRIPRLPLPEGSFRVSYQLFTDGTMRDALDTMTNAAELGVLAGDFYGSGKIPRIQSGVCLVDGSWSAESQVAPFPTHAPTPLAR